MGFQDWLDSGTEQEKKKKRMLLAGGILGLFLLFWLMSGKNDRKEPKKPEEMTGSEFFTLEEKKVWITRFEKDLQDLGEKITELNQAMQKTRQQIEADQQKWQAKIEEKIRALEEQPHRMPPELPSGYRRPGPSAGAEEWPPDIGIVQPVPIQVYRASPEEERPRARAPEEKEKPPGTPAAKAALPAGSFARASLLTGVDAPSGGQPYPVVFLVKEHFTGPNSTQIPLKGCLVIGKAEGSLSSERAIIQLARLSCTIGQNTPVEQEISGYAVDKDGKLGLKGKVVSKAGRKIAASLLANFTAGLGAAIRESEVDTIYNPQTGNVVSVPTGDITRMTIASGVARSADELGKFFLQQAREIFPVVEVEAGRSSYVVIQSGIEIKGLEVAGDQKYHFSDSD